MTARAPAADSEDGREDHVAGEKRAVHRCGPLGHVEQHGQAQGG